KRAVDLGLLRQIGDVARAQPAQVDPAGERRQDADDAFEQGRLAGAIRTDDGHERATLDRAVEVVHGRMTVVAERQIAELKLRAHVSFIQSPAPIRPRPTTRRSRPQRRQAVPAPTCAGSTARPWPAGAHGPDDDGDDGGRDSWDGANVRE